MHAKLYGGYMKFIDNLIKKTSVYKELMQDVEDKQRALDQKEITIYNLRGDYYKLLKQNVELKAKLERAGVK